MIFRLIKEGFSSVNKLLIMWATFVMKLGVCVVTTLAGKAADAIKKSKGNSRAVSVSLRKNLS